MANKELARFVSEYLGKHPEVTARMDKITDDRTLALALAEEGAKSGFAFTAEDVLKIAGRRPAAGGELTEADLQAVAGGRSDAKPMAYLTIKMTDTLITSY